MARQNVPFLTFNRGLVSPKALGRVDLDRTRLSAAVYTNWLPKTQGAMTLRPGTKWFGSSYGDTGAQWIEFVASTDDVALLEATDGRMRVWLGDDAHALALLARPKVDTTVSLTDTGWSETSTGGTASVSGVDLIPTMTAATTSGVTMSGTAIVSSPPWQAGDDTNASSWFDTGSVNGSGVFSTPSVLKVDFGAGNAKTVERYTMRAGNAADQLDNMARSWDFSGSNDDSSYTLLDTGGDQTGWSVSEKRTFAVGSPASYRYYKWTIRELNRTSDSSTYLNIAEVELFQADSAGKVVRNSAGATLNATAIGSLARIEKRVIVSDTGAEHSLAVRVARGPVTLRVGSSQRDDDYIAETALGAGDHNLAFTPTGNFWVTLQSDAQVNRIVESLAIGDSGTVEIAAPWGADDIANIRYDQSADVVYVDCDGIRPSKIERRGTGRSWSIVDYAPNNGPFLSSPSSSANMSVSHYFGNTTLNSDIPFFTSDHVGALMRIFHDGQSGQWRLGAAGAHTGAIKMTGISDTGTPGADSERRIVFSVTGTWAGRITIKRSIDGEDRGFKPIPASFASPSDTGTFTKTIDDPDDNLAVWYRAEISDTGTGSNGYTSGVAIVTATYGGGGVTGIARITDYNSNTDVNIEVLSNFSDTGPSKNWQQGYWSRAKGFPTAVALHGGRLAHAQGGSLFLTVSDDYENYDEETIGDAGPIIRTLGSGPVDNIHYLVSILRLIVGTAGAELVLTSSSLDEPVTPNNSNARGFSTQGSANVRAVKLDTKAIMVQRSRQRVFMVGPGAQGNALGDYEIFELTLLVPDLLAAGAVSIAVQRQPDTRIHCVLGDGTVAILTYEPQEEVLCWSLWQTDGWVEKAMVLPGLGEDAVYYHVRRSVNGQTRRFLEKWAMESECLGDTGLSWLMDCARSYTDTGRTATLIDIAAHLPGEALIVWSDDTGSIPGVDRSPDVAGVQTTYTADTGGDISLSVAVHHAVAGLPYTADWTSTKLAYAAEAGTALAQMKRTDKIAFVLYQTHNRGLLFGSDSGHLDAMPRVIDGGARVDENKIFAEFDQVSMPFPGLWKSDSRIHLRAKAPRPCTVLAIVPTVQTNEKV